MESYQKLKKMLCKELENVVDDGKISAGNLEMIDKLTHSIKSLDAIMAMEESGYSREGGYSRAGEEMEEMVESIRSMMQELPEDVQMDAQRFVQKLEQQM